MHLQGKAIFNLLRKNWIEDPALQVKPWQVEDYRILPTEELHKRLKRLGVMITKENFASYAEECGTPEDLTDCLWLDEEDEEGYDEAYLNIFEIWRRDFSENPSLSIFCDELDVRIDLYDLEDIEPLLTTLEDLLDEQVDKGLTPKEAFAFISSYLSNDLEIFLYEYIAEQIDLGNTLEASEFLNGIYDYVKGNPLFAILRARDLLLTDEDAAYSLLMKILEDLKEEELGALFEILDLFVDGRNPSLFLNAALQATYFIHTKEDFEEFQSIIVNFYKRSGEDKRASAFLAFSKDSIEKARFLIQEIM